MSLRHVSITLLESTAVDEPLFKKMETRLRLASTALFGLSCQLFMMKYRFNTILGLYKEDIASAINCWKSQETVFWFSSNCVIRPMFGASATGEACGVCVYGENEPRQRWDEGKRCDQ